MAKHPRNTDVRALALGVLSGGRSMTPLAGLALAHDRKDVRGSWQGWPVFRSPIGRGVLLAMALGELVGDKLPNTPNRISPLGLLGRIGSGAFAGAAIGTTGTKSRAFEGALLGGFGALVGSLGGWALRKAVGALTHAPDAVVAVGEDAAVVAGTRRALRV